MSYFDSSYLFRLYWEDAGFAEVRAHAAHAQSLACAREHGFTEIYSNDRHLLTAAPLFGIKGVNLIPIT